MNALTPQIAAWLNKQSEAISFLRDKTLVFAGFIYLVGYVIWSFYSWIYNLGLLPPLQLQYFVAGSVSIIILVVAKVIWSVENWFLKEKWPAFVGPDVTGGRLALRRAIIWINVISLIGWFLFQMLIPSIRSQTELQAPILFYTFLISLVLLPPDVKLDDGLLNLWVRFLRKLTLGFIPFIIVSVGLLYFYNDIYPMWPQELGGVKPKCALLDVDKNKLSTETLDAIFPDGSTTLDHTIARSVRVDVYYSGGGVLLVKPNHSQGEKTFTTYEIKKSTIEVITWCS